MPVENRRVFFEKLQRLRRRKYENCDTDYVVQNANEVLAIENLRTSASTKELRRAKTIMKKAEIDTELQKKKIFEVVKRGYLKQIKVQKFEEMTVAVKNNRRSLAWVKLAEVFVVFGKVFAIFDAQRSFIQHLVFKNLQAAKIQRAFKRYILRCK